MFPFVLGIRKMRVVIPQITWNNRQPVLCIDIDPSTFPRYSTNGSEGETKTQFYRVATGGSDNHLLIWHLQPLQPPKFDIICVAELTRHTKSVNAVRFSPCGKYLASADDDAFVVIWRHETEKDSAHSESWNPEKILRKHVDDVSDISWSADSTRLVTCSVDNAAIIWDVKKGTPLQMMSEHEGYVQGVSYDPKGSYVATMSTDRGLRLFNSQTGKLISRTLKYPLKWLPKELKSSEGVETKDEKNENLEPKKSVTPFCNRIFHDDTLQTFSRRLSFSPGGEFLVVPGGILPPTVEDTDKSGLDDLESTPGRKNSKKMNKDKPLSSKHAIIIFCRNSFANPCSIIPTGSSFTVAARFSPKYYQRNRKAIAYGDVEIPITKSERGTTCAARLKDSKSEKKVLLDMPYRQVFAVAANDSVIISDTESPLPLAIVRKIHCTRTTDLSWSADGRLLIVSSMDGYCSIIVFEENELGIPYTEEVTIPHPNAFPVSLPPVRMKVDKLSKKRSRPQTPTTMRESPSTTASSNNTSPSIRDSEKSTPTRKRNSAKSFPTPGRSIASFFKVNESPPTKVREKRPASSPTTSHQVAKQPRRIELITIPDSPKKDE